MEFESVISWLYAVTQNREEYNKLSEDLGNTVSICAPVTKVVHLGRGLEQIADIIGAEVKEEPFRPDLGYPIHKSFDFNGYTFIQLYGEENDDNN